MDLGLWTLDPRTHTLDPGPQNLDPIPRSPDPGPWTWTPDPGPWTLDPGSTAGSSAVYSIQVSKCPIILLSKISAFCIGPNQFSQRPPSWNRHNGFRPSLLLPNLTSLWFKYFFIFRQQKLSRLTLAWPVVQTLHQNESVLVRFLGDERRVRDPRGRSRTLANVADISGFLKRNFTSGSKLWLMQQM